MNRQKDPPVFMNSTNYNTEQTASAKHLLSTQNAVLWESSWEHTYKRNT